MDSEEHKGNPPLQVAPPQHTFESEIPPHQGLIRSDNVVGNSPLSPSQHSQHSPDSLAGLNKRQTPDSPDDDEDEDDDDDEPDRKKQKGEGEKGAKKKKKAGGSGRRRIEIKFIENKSRRQVTFSRRKRGLMKKAYELTTLTGTQALVLIASETGHVYTFATPKLQPVVTLREGKELIQSCLNAPDNNYPTDAYAPPPVPQQQHNQGGGGPSIPKTEPHPHVSPAPTQHHQHHDPHSMMGPMGYGQPASLPGIHHGGMPNHGPPHGYPSSIGGYPHVDHNPMGYQMGPAHGHGGHGHHPHSLGQMGLGGHMQGNPHMQVGMGQHGGQQKRGDHMSPDQDSRNGVPHSHQM